MSEKNEVMPVEVPVEILSPEALNGIMDNFINREGTDYGLVEVTYDKKIEQVRRLLARGDIKIVFDPDSETVTLLTLHDWKKINLEKSQ